MPVDVWVWVGGVALSVGVCRTSVGVALAVLLGLLVWRGDRLSVKLEETERAAVGVGLWLRMVEAEAVADSVADGCRPSDGDVVRVGLAQPVGVAERLPDGVEVLVGARVRL